MKLFAASVGVEKATDAVVAAAARLGIRRADFTMDEAIRVLESLATTPGVVGTVARFAKARFLLQSQ